MTTFAWVAYSKVLEPTLNLHISSWDMQYKIAGELWDEDVPIGISTLYPAMAEQTVTIDIFNNGERTVDIDYYLQSISIAGVDYELVQEGNTNTTDDYIVYTQSYLETDPTTSKKIVRGAVTNDITQFPFTIEIEHSAEIEPKTTDAGGNTTGGEGYLTVRVNWSGDDNDLDSRWGYIVGEYLAANPTAAAISMNLAIDSYQVEEDYEEIINMPSTPETSPYLPTGFTRVAGTTLKTGLVIKDALGNEYVWIEVPRNATVYGASGLGITAFSATDYTTIENALKTYSAAYRTRDEVYTSNRAIGVTLDEYTTLKNAMLKSIYQKGGFYIGRYETGIIGAHRTGYVTTTEQTPVIKANAYPYNYVSCSQAQTLSENMASGEYHSSLMFGLQWDLVLKYLETKGSVTQDELKTDSTAIGNYYNNTYYILNRKAKYSLDNATTWLASPYEKIIKSPVVLTTGANSLFSKQNIYDLGGNVSEWTFNVILDGTTPRGGNGGNYFETNNNVANYCGTYDTTTGARNVGFRVTIF